MLQRHARKSELATVAIVILISTAVAIHHMTRLMASAERQSMAATVNHIKSGLMLEAVHRLVRGDLDALAALAGENPMGSTLRRVGNYLGEMSDAQAQSVDGGFWYFDTGISLLGYRVNHVEYFRTALPGVKRALFRVELLYVDVDGDGQFTSSKDTFNGITIKPVQHYAWDFTGLG